MSEGALAGLAKLARGALPMSSPARALPHAPSRQTTNVTIRSGAKIIQITEVPVSEATER
jgi:hypothetical protein